ncbi:Hypothetical protein GLP15_3624 [Giardia lamblia P15]|uniref:Ankyrin repeat protein n=1 Tax=Giardia intestinalis (strain P15) TaxID=658858 RepID=E1F676_GIAIA|nr:Hypothetical protein GLP15_3624 [Giardia lamblia P15]
MLWTDMLHLCQQSSLPSRLESKFIAAVSACDPHLLLRCLLSAAQYGNIQAVEIINKATQDRTYTTKHTALSIAIEYRHEAIAKILLPTEACITKVTTAMSRVIMGNQLYSVEVQLALSKDSCFRELSERDVVGRSLVEYCIIFRRTTLLVRILEQIMKFHLDTDPLYTACHEPVIFLAIREKDLDSFTALYDFCCYHGLDRSIDNQSLKSYSMSTGALDIAHWLSKRLELGGHSGATPTIEASRRSAIPKSADHEDGLSKVTRCSQLGEESKLQYSDHTLAPATSKRSSMCLSEKFEHLVSMLSRELEEYAIKHHDSILAHDKYIEACGLSYSAILSQLALLDRDKILQESVHSVIYTNSMITTIIHASFYTNTPDALDMATSWHKPLLAELSAVKLYGIHPVFSINIIVKPPGTIVVQEALLQSEEVLGLTPFSDPQRFIRLNPLNYDSALDTLEWFLSTPVSDMLKIFLQDKLVVEVPFNRSHSVVQLEAGIDLVMHSNSPYFKVVPPCDVECKTKDGRLLVLTSFSNGLKEIVAHMQDKYVFVSDSLIMGLKGKYIRDLLKPG